jgi:hypothetical protein
MLLPGIQPLRITSMLLLYIGADGEVLAAAGGSGGFVDELHRSDDFVLADTPKECAAGLSTEVVGRQTTRRCRSRGGSPSSRKRAAAMAPIEARSAC